MRIISGTLKGKHLYAPKNLPVRPTTDMAKESLFNILGNRFHFEELSVFDLFSGTGNIAFEFASRGAKDTLAVDSFPGCVKFISKTAGELGLPIRTLRSDVFKFLERTTEKADVIFADPPYDFDQGKFLKIVEPVFERGLLKEQGLLVVEHDSKTDLSSHPKFTELRKYGGSRFSFFTPD